MDKLKLITNIFPNKKMKRFIKKGNKQLNQMLDLMAIIKQHSVHNNFLKQHDEDMFEDEFINLDSGTDDEKPTDEMKPNNHLNMVQLS